MKASAHVKIILTVTGLDHEGIVAAVATRLAERKVNILNISQTLMDNYFTMILQGSFDESSQSIQDLQAAFEEVEKEQGLQIRIQSESIFDAMHTL
ncbi:ACT domain-containing protein [Rothia aerolata]|uniref:UPF0237 protein GCM10007359_18560 n=1 Tax=Rothia aerolata TaxID=1812262 RepID=A0A917IYB3_9MICC|nr:ACT domain-containing protein [Rothia aerolata]GGH65379.1 UPF0237 protein Cgl1544/cg1742 [Rothia aerolata]